MKSITDLYNKYLNSGKSCVVLGCGESAKQFVKNPAIFSIGVNDIGLHVNPDILMLVDNKQKFERDSINRPNRISNIESVKSDYYVLTDNTWNFDENKKYLFKLGKYCANNNFVANLGNNDLIDYGHDSPFMAIILAYKLGFRNIAILGVDYTPNHFYSIDGQHQLIQLNYQNKLESLYNTLNIIMKNNNTTLYNLSESSIIKSIEKIKLSDFYLQTNKTNNNICITN